MPSNEPNSHFVTRRLTRTWECEQRQLFFYDFEQDRFCLRPSRRLLTASESFGEELEVLLNRHVETPLAAYLDAVDEGDLIEDLPWAQRRALILSVLLQGPRVAAGRGDGEQRNYLRFLLLKGDAFLDQLASGAHDAWRFVGGKLGRSQQLFFPSVGLAAVPLRASCSAPAILFQPSSLNTFFACLPAELAGDAAEDELRTAMSNGRLVACSVGLTCDRVIVPPALRAEITEETLRTVLHSYRSRSANWSVW